MWILKAIGVALAAIGTLMIFTHSVGIPLHLHPAAHEGFAIKKLALGIILLGVGLFMITKN